MGKLSCNLPIFSNNGELSWIFTFYAVSLHCVSPNMLNKIDFNLRGQEDDSRGEKFFSLPSLIFKFPSLSLLSCLFFHKYLLNTNHVPGTA